MVLCEATQGVTAERRVPPTRAPLGRVLPTRAPLGKVLPTRAPLGRVPPTRAPLGRVPPTRAPPCVKGWRKADRTGRQGHAGGQAGSSRQAGQAPPSPPPPPHTQTRRYTACTHVSMLIHPPLLTPGATSSLTRRTGTSTLTCRSWGQYRNSMFSSSMLRLLMLKLWGCAAHSTQQGGGGGSTAAATAGAVAGG